MLLVEHGKIEPDAAQHLCGMAGWSFDESTEQMLAIEQALAEVLVALAVHVNLH